MKVIVILSSCIFAAVFGCGGDLSATSGAFTSPNHPADYSNNANCEWTYTVPAGQRVALTFSAFRLEGGSSCPYDKIEVRDSSSSGSLLHSFCGSSIPETVYSTSNTMYVRFSSDSSLAYSGFQAQFSSVTGGGDGGAGTARPPVSGCGGDFNSATGSLTSPNYPSDYDNNADCTWTITIPEGIVLLSFNDFDLETSSTCSYDKLDITDTASGTRLASICGGGKASVDGTSNSVTLRFSTDSSVTGKGFSLTWTRLTCAEKGGNCVSEAECDGDVRDNLFCSASTVCCFPRFNQGACGVVPPRPSLIGGKPRIVGGDAANEHEWPWQASLQTTSSSFHFCGGSIISDRWIVTAAHCVDGDTPSGLKVVTGEHHQVSDSGKEQDHAVQGIYMHEAYDGNGAGFPNDIALLKLSNPITLNNERLPICLAAIDDQFLGDHCFITGWGLTQGTGDDDMLNELNVDVWNQATCQNTWGSSYVNPGHICVGTGDTGACNGDSGGPLACKKTVDGQDRWVLAGATSWGRSGCQTAGYPSVYSRVSFFREWIDRTIMSNN